MIQQLSLFTESEPTIEDITIEWLYNYLISILPQLKWQYTEYIDGSKAIEQTKNKKINITVHLGKFNESVTWVKCKRYIGINANKKCGDYEGVGLSFTSVDEFKKEIIKICEKYNGVEK